MDNTESLGDKLFRLVQESQGFAFISDGIGEMTDEQVMTIARSSLSWTIESAAVLMEFIEEQEKGTQ